MCETVDDCKKWVKAQPCGPEKKAIFINECDLAINHDNIDYLANRSYDQIQDYIDALRRNYYER